MTCFNKPEFSAERIPGQYTAAPGRPSFLFRQVIPPEQSQEDLFQLKVPSLKEMRTESLTHFSPSSGSQSKPLLSFDAQNVSFL